MATRYGMVFVMVFLAFMLSTLYAVSFESYPIGCFSYIWNNDWRNPYTPAERAQILTMIKDMGYNIVQVDNRDNDNALSGLLTMLHNNDLYAIMEDIYYPTSTIPDVNYNRYSATAPTTSSYLKFEAEYTSGSDVDGGGNDVNWYCSHAEHSGHMPRVGYPIDESTLPSGKAWKCTRGTTNPGFAFTDIRWRWQKNETGLTEPERLGDEFWIYDEHDNTNKFLYVRFKIKIGSIIPNATQTTPLFSFITMGYRGINSTDSTTVNHQFTDYNSNLLVSHTTDYCYGDYVFAGNPDGYYDVEIKLSYADLISSGLITNDTDDDPTNDADWWRYKLINLNSRLLWHSNCDLSIDYVEIEDHIHHNMSTNPALYQTNVNYRIDYLQSQHTTDIVKFMYGRDEPFLGQFESFRRIKDMINNNSNPKLITASYDTDYNKIPMPGVGRYYDHVKCSRENMNPNIVLPDMYPIRPGINFNNTNSIQNTIDDKVLKQYKNTKQFCLLSNPYKPFIPIVQAFGSWKGTYWESWILPPYETQKCLRYLPLCYAADGIIDYRVVYKFTGNIINNPPGDYCAIIKDESGLINNSNITRNAITGSNQKIGFYGPFIKEKLTWNDASRILVSSEPDGLLPQTSLSSMGIGSLQVEDPHDGLYSGYIQCGFFTDNSNIENPFFMLVNRRSNYFNAGGISTSTCPPSNYATHYLSASPQSARFVTNEVAHNRFGSYLAMHDIYDDELFRADGDTIKVAIDAGEGRLVEIVSTLPNVVVNDCLLSNKAILDGNITILPGVHVSITDGTKTRIRENSIISILEGASFTLMDSVVVENNVKFIVSPNGNLQFSNANSYFGAADSIIVIGGSLTIENSALNITLDSDLWAGIRARLSSTIILSNSSFNGARYHSFENCNLFVSNCRFDIPENSYGFVINNREPGFSTQIINIEEAKGFYGDSNSTSKGIILGSIENKVIIHNVNFNNLLVGIWKSSNISERDSIAYSHFLSCSEGMKAISSNYVPKIEHCSFVSNSIGIRLTAATPFIDECDFVNGSKGIVTEYSLTPEIWYKNGVFNSNFTNAAIGLESRGSNHRIETSYFNMNQRGIVNHAKSNLNIGWTANNVFHNQINNIEFYEEHPYESTIQVFKGHNDFYHYLNNQTDSVAYDFFFDENYYNNQWNPEHRIDVSRNWFQDFDVRVNEPYQDYVYIDSYDPSNNMPAPPPDIEDRFYIALTNEAEGLYEEAFNMFKAILDDPYPEEKRYLPSAADGIYRLSYFTQDPSWSKSGYFDLKAIQYAVDDELLVALLKEYLAKSYIEDKEYQNAIDLIQLRIDNPLSEVDSLLAILDLEIVLQLYSMEESKAPITTKYQQYKYSDVQTFNTRHDEHWNQLYELLDKNEESNIDIPAIPAITSNYPNPFNPSTTIAYYIPVKSIVKMAIYNVKGQRVKDLISNEIPKGTHQIIWDGNDNSGRVVSSGLYLVRIGIGNNVDTHKIMMLK
jgi:hypothetical protein